MKRVIVVLITCLFLIWVLFSRNNNKKTETLINFNMSGSQIIHQSWKTHDVPKGLFLDNLNKWKKFHPNALHVLWSDQDNNHFVKTFYPEFYLTFTSKMLSSVQRSDIARLLYLHKYGGLYADLDYEPFTNVFDTLGNESMYIVQSPVLLNEVMQNSLMISKEPGQRFWYEVVKTIVKIVTYLEDVKGCEFGCGDLALFHNIFTMQLANMVKTTSITGPSVLDKTYVLYPVKIGLLPSEKYFVGTITKHHQTSVWVNVPWAIKEMIGCVLGFVVLWTWGMYWWMNRNKIKV